MHNRPIKTAAFFAFATVLFLSPLPANAAEPQNANVPVAPATVQDIKAYCLDFNWATGTRRRVFARPGSWAGADPASHVAWYKAMGVNVIQTFCVSCNGYSRKAIDRCWKTIRKAAKDANPSCIVWLTSNHMNHPHVVDSDMYREADWLMNEAGDMQRIDAVKNMVGEHTRLITCLARWNGRDATKVVPEALKAGVGLYGFTKPRNSGGLVPLEEILSRPVSELQGDDRNIAVLARAYHGAAVDTVRNEKGEFVKIEAPKSQSTDPNK